MAGINNHSKEHLNYQKNQIMSLTPAQLVLKIYDYAILGCKLKNSQKVSKALIELISGLNFNYGEIPLGLFRLYQYCLDIIKKDQFEEALKILSELRDAWIDIVKEESKPQKNIKAKVV